MGSLRSDRPPWPVDGRDAGRLARVIRPTGIKRWNARRPSAVMRPAGVNRRHLVRLTVVFRGRHRDLQPFHHWTLRCFLDTLNCKRWLLHLSNKMLS